MAISVHPYPFGAWMARPCTVMPDLMMLQCVAEQASSPASHAGRPEKCQNAREGERDPPPPRLRYWHRPQASLVDVSHCLR
jgi:hypothetical protein